VLTVDSALVRLQPTLIMEQLDARVTLHSPPVAIVEDDHQSYDEHRVLSRANPGEAEAPHGHTPVKRPPETRCTLLAIPFARIRELYRQIQISVL